MIKWLKCLFSGHQYSTIRVHGWVFEDVVPKYPQLQICTKCTKLKLNLKSVLPTTNFDKEELNRLQQLAGVDKLPEPLPPQVSEAEELYKAAKNVNLNEMEVDVKKFIEVNSISESEKARGV